MAYGFRDIESLKLKIMALHETKYILSNEPACAHLPDEAELKSSLY